MNFFKKLGQVVKGIAPVLAGVASVFLPGIAIAPKILAALPGLISSAENAFGDGTGPIKKQYVMEGAERIVATMTDVSTGGQKETWEAIAPLASTIVDGIIAGTKIIDEDLFDDYGITEQMKYGQ
jgi:hypothetical protein